MSHQLKKIGDRWYVGLDAAAEFIGVSSMTVRNWMSEGVSYPPYDTTHAMFPLKELGDWVGRERLFKTGRGGSYPFMPDLTRLPGVGETGADGQELVLNKQREETLLARERRLSLELDRAEKEGRLVDAEAVTRANLKMVSIVKTRLLRIPSAYAPAIHAERDVHAVQSALDRAIREALEELSVTTNEVDEDVE